MVRSVLRRATRLREVAFKELSLALQNESENEDMTESYEVSRTRYEQEMKERTKQKEIDALYATTATRAKVNCKSADFEWDFAPPQLTITTNLSLPNPAKTPAAQQTISPSPAPSSASISRVNNPFNLPTTATSPLPTPVSASTDENGDFRIPDVPATINQNFPLPIQKMRKRTPEEILSTLAMNLRTLVDRAAFEIAQYDVHAKKVGEVYRSALERRGVRDGDVGASASTPSLVSRSNAAPVPIPITKAQGGKGANGVGDAGVKTGKETGKKIKEEIFKKGDENRRMSSGMPLTSSGKGTVRAMESIEDLVRRGTR